MNTDKVLAATIFTVKAYEYGFIQKAKVEDGLKIAHIYVILHCDH